nr:hypothetical protein [Ectobacillus panaciterrae]
MNGKAKGTLFPIEGRIAVIPAASSFLLEANTIVSTGNGADAIIYE